MEKEKTVRIGLGSFDLIKGIAILCVVIGHMNTRFPLEEVPILAPMYLIPGIIGQSLMPVFLILSGYGHKQKSPGYMLKKSFSDLIVPYLCAAIITVCMRFVLCWPLYGSMIDRLRNIGSVFLGFILGLPLDREIFGYDAVAVSVLWFFLALFIAENLLNLITRVKNTAIQLLFVVVCIVLGYVLLDNEFNFYCIPQGVHAVGFCYLGYILKKYRFIEQKLYSIWTYILLGAFFVTRLIWSYSSLKGFSMVRGDYSLFMYLASGVSGIFLIFLGILCNRYEWLWLKWIRKIGMQSYWIVVIHAIESTSFPWYELDSYNSIPVMAFVIELGLKIVVFMIGCMIFKKISQIKYRKKLIRNARKS